MTLPQPTDRQTKRLREIADEAREKFGVDIHGADRFDLIFREETRPGRGHDLTFIYGDGEHVVQGVLDVYGSGDWAVGKVEWIHSTADDDCKCGKGGHE